MLVGIDILSDCHLIETLTPRLQLPVASSKNTRPRVGLPTSVPKRPMSSSVPYQSPRPPQTPFAFLRRFGRSGGSRQPDLAPAVSAIAPKTPDPAVAQPPPRPRTSPPAALSEADQALCRNADAYAQRYNWVVAQTEEPLEAGLFLENGEVCAWAIDRDEPARAISLALVVDGSAVFEAWTDPDANEIAIATGYHLQGHRTFDLWSMGSLQEALPSRERRSGRPRRPARIYSNFSIASARPIARRPGNVTCSVISVMCWIA